MQLVLPLVLPKHWQLLWYQGPSSKASPFYQLKKGAQTVADYLRSVCFIADSLAAAKRLSMIGIWSL